VETEQGTTELAAGQSTTLTQPAAQAEPPEPTVETEEPEEPGDRDASEYVP